VLLSVKRSSLNFANFHIHKCKQCTPQKNFIAKCTVAIAGETD
jgi:hypothetical protein